MFWLVLLMGVKLNSSEDLDGNWSCGEFYIVQEVVKLVVRINGKEGSGEPACSRAIGWA